MGRPQGKAKKQNKCINCDKDITDGAERCRRCSAIRNNEMGKIGPKNLREKKGKEYY